MLMVQNWPRNEKSSEQSGKDSATFATPLHDERSPTYTAPVPSQTAGYAAHVSEHEKMRALMANKEQLMILNIQDPAPIQMGTETEPLRNFTLDSRSNGGVVSREA